MTVGDWNTLRHAASQGYADAIICLASIEIIERSNRPEVIGPLNEADAGRAVRILADAAFFRVQIFLTRAFAPVRRGDYHLRAAMDFLRAPGRLDEVTPVEDRPRYERAIALFHEAEADPALKLLSHMRHKSMAHLAIPDPSVPLPKYDELFAFARRCAEIWQELSYAARVVMIDIDHQIDAYRESADALWGKWEHDSRD